MTRKIGGFVYGFCNWKLRESELELSCLAHNTFGLDSNKLKFIDTCKYLRTSLASLANTIDKNEKSKTELILKQFISQHDYFSLVWKSLPAYQKDGIIEIFSSGKGLIPYEEIINMNSLEISPEKDFFNKDEFCNELKQKQALDDDYE